MPRQLEITIPLEQWHNAMLNPELWVESIEAVRRISGAAVYDTTVQETNIMSEPRSLSEAFSPRLSAQ